MYFVVMFCALMGLWTLFSGRFDAMHLGMGVISCALVTAMSRPLWFEQPTVPLVERLRMACRFVHYCVWLTVEIVRANMHVLALALHPKPRDVINPEIVRFETTLKSDFARVVLANSITLTPGTVTIRIHEDTFIVHAISDKVAAGVPGEMEARVAKVFGETDDA
jgi:multicomponent Na+:H+ antiporter subunit E